MKYTSTKTSPVVAPVVLLFVEVIVVDPVPVVALPPLAPPLVEPVLVPVLPPAAPPPVDPVLLMPVPPVTAVDPPLFVPLAVSAAIVAL